MQYQCLSFDLSIVKGVDVLCSLQFEIMAGQAPEGSQFDGRHYDAKMDEL